MGRYAHISGDFKMFSPIKIGFHQLLENVDTMDGLHLIYSQFRTIEGIGVFSMVLEANGYHRFKLKKV